MTIRVNTRSVIRSTHKIYAQVESIALGKAAVRLGTNGTGARMTNIPYTGDIEVGDLVILDRTSDPIIYPTIIKREEETNLALSTTSVVAQIKESTLPIAKITASSSLTSQYIYNANYVVNSFKYYTDATNYSVGIPFDTVVYDPDGLFTVANITSTVSVRGLIIKRPGVYHLSCNVKLKTDLGYKTGGLKFSLGRAYYSSSQGDYQGATGFIGKKYIRFNPDPDKEVGLHVNGITRLKEGDLIYTDIQHTYRGNDIEDNNQFFTCVVSDGYPSLTVMLIADQETGVQQANRDWFMYLPGSIYEETIGNKY